MGDEDDQLTPGSDQEIDWSSIIKNRTLSLRIGYVLILEWLPDHDAHGREEPRTGQQLAEWLRRKFGENRIEYCRCNSATDIASRLAQATLDVHSRGIPVVHIEAHGSPEGFVGPSESGGVATLMWQELGEMLRPLNIASQFNLMIVGAACYGEGLLLAIEGDKPMPFVAVVGYTDTINPASLKDSMVEMYRQLFSNQEELGVAVEEADRQHRYSDDAVLRPTPTTVLALEAFIDMARNRVGVDTHEEYALDMAAKAMRTNGYDLSVLPYSTMKAMSKPITRAALESGWQLLWMTREMPENAERFAIDFDRAVDVASRLSRI